MTVAELRAILAHLPDEMPVIVTGHGQHASVVQRHPRGDSFIWVREERCERCNEHQENVYESVPHGGYVEIRPPNGYGAHRQPFFLGRPAPPIQIAGPVRDRKGLSAELDALNPFTSEPS